MPACAGRTARSENFSPPSDSRRFHRVKTFARANLLKAVQREPARNAHLKLHFPRSFDVHASHKTHSSDGLTYPIITSFGFSFLA